MILSELATKVHRLYGRLYHVETHIGTSRTTVSVQIRRKGDYGIESPAVTIYGRMQRNGSWKATVGADHASYYSMTPELATMLSDGREIASLIGQISS